MSNDNKEWTKADFAAAVPMKEVMPEVLEAFKRGRGRPVSDAPKVHIGMRLDADVVEWLRSHKGYNVIVNAALRKEMKREERGGRDVSQ